MSNPVGTGPQTIGRKRKSGRRGEKNGDFKPRDCEGRKGGLIYVEKG